MPGPYRLGAGLPFPYGVHLDTSGVNVAWPVSHAARVELCLFSSDGSRELARIPLPEWTDGVRHGHIDGVGPGDLYGLRVHGPYDPHRGHRFNAHKLLVDPWARALDRPFRLHPSQFAFRTGDPLADLSFDTVDSAPHMPKARVTAPAPAASPLRPAHPWTRTLVYELHVKGMTALHPDVPAAQRGTLAGLAHPAVLQHLVRLGVTTVEFLPIAAFADERHLVEKGLSNYWGYNPVAFVATDPGYQGTEAADELQRTLEAFHAAGLEVLLDVVFNHSGEGDELGPTLSLRGLDNALYYRLDPADPRRYVNDAGCGNVLAVDRPPVLRLVMDSLRHWAAMGFDGFRFDLATTLARGEQGFEPNGPFLAALRQEPVLSALKLVMEPWDIGYGGYRLGEFPPGMPEWNDRSRDTLRRFWRGDPGQVAPLATILAGSADRFAGRAATTSVNFVTAHDGFTLRDLVSYAAKHNDANGEHGRDGTDGNHSWNHGVEGPSADPAVTAARADDLRALLASLILARGTPMLTMGDERGRSQGGNNNAYCQDNATSWLDWSAIPAEAVGLEALIPALMRLRRDHPALEPRAFLTGREIGDTGFKDVAWRREDGQELNDSDWHDPGRRFVGMELCAEVHGDETRPDHVLILLNAGHDRREVSLPEPRWRWHLALATKGDAARRVIRAENVAIEGRSVTVLVDEPAPSAEPDPAMLRRLARLAAIEPVWHDIEGHRHDVGQDTLQALLAAMRLPCERPADLEASLRLMEERRWRRSLTPIIVSRPGGSLTLDLVVPQEASWRPQRLLIEQADGERRAIDLAPGSHTSMGVRVVDGQRRERFRIELHEELPVGTHRITLEGHGPEATLIVAPETCYLPDWLRRGERRWGVTAHLYTLRREGDLGIGDFTTLERLVDRVASWGGAAIGLNPLHTLFPAQPERASPYYPSDRRFLDIRYLDPERLIGAERRTPRQEQLSAMLRATSITRLIDYPVVVAAKLELAALAFEETRELFRRRPDHPLAQDLAGFVAKGGVGLRALAEFLDPARPELQTFIQWQLELQLAAAGSMAKARLEVGLYRDLAVGAAPDGAEVRTGQERFAQGVSIGAPPDPFSRDGQVWGVPPFDPLALQETGLAAWRELLTANMRHAGALRLDHAMGLERLFWVPSGASPKDGAYVRYPTEALIAALSVASHEAQCMAVGEDLGTVSHGFRERMDHHGILSTRVLWFEREGMAFKPATAYPRRAVACASTHDLATVQGFWEGNDIDLRASVQPSDPERLENEHAHRAQERDALQKVLALRDPSMLQPAAHRFLAATPSALVLAQVEDLAQEVEQLNLPGTDREHPNWRRRVEPTVEALGADTAVGAIVEALRRS